MFNEFTSVEEYAGGFVVGDVEEVEPFSCERVLVFVDDGEVEAFGGFEVCPDRDDSNEEDDEEPDNDAAVGGESFGFSGIVIVKVRRSCGKERLVEERIM